MLSPRRPAALPRKQIVPVFFPVSCKSEHFVAVNLKTVTFPKKFQPKLKLVLRRRGCFFPFANRLANVLERILARVSIYNPPMQASGVQPLVQLGQKARTATV